MNNWDKRPSITVIFGGEGQGVSIEELKIVAEDIGMEGPMPDHIDHYGILTYTNGDIDDLHLQLVVESLAEYLNDYNSWLSHQNDLLVDKDTWTWVDVAYGKYRGPNCDVHAWMVTS